MKFPSPDTPTSWIIEQLKTSAALGALMGFEPSSAPIFQVGNVPSEDDQPAVFIVVKPPASMDARVYAERFPTGLSGQFLIYAETRSDQLPQNAGFGDVLTPVMLEIAETLAGVDAPSAPNGGSVWSCWVTGYYTPRALDLTEHLQIAQRGVFASLLST